MRSVKQHPLYIYAKANKLTQVTTYKKGGHYIQKFLSEMWYQGRHFKHLTQKNKLMFSSKLFTMFVLIGFVVSITSNTFVTIRTYALNGDSNLNGYIWENDDGSTADGNSQIAAGNGSVSVPKGSRMNLRAQIKNTGSAMDLSKLGLFYDRGDEGWSRVETNQKQSDAGLSLDIEFIDSSTNSTMRRNQNSDMAQDSSKNVWMSSYTNIAGFGLAVTRYVGSGGNCDSPKWECTLVDNTSANVGQDTSIVIDSTDKAWVSYYDLTNTALKVAQYVGSGGTGCTSTAWTCTTVDNTGTSLGQYTSVTFDNNNKAWISYYDLTNTALKVAQYVGSGGTGCTSTAWTCTTIDNTGTSTGQFSSIAKSVDNVPWISYYDTTNTALKVAQYVGSGGTGCTSTAWTCTTVETTNSGFIEETNTSITFNPVDGKAWVLYASSNNDSTYLARFVGSGGTGCASTAWSCVLINQFQNDSTARIGFGLDDLPTAYFVGFANTNPNMFSVSLSSLPDVGSSCQDSSIFECTIVDATVASQGQYVSTALDAYGNAWTSYLDSTNGNLRVARFVGSGGTGCTSTAWTCVSVFTAVLVTTYTSIAFDATNSAWIAFRDDLNGDLYVAKYVGSGGTGCASTAWTCTLVELTNLVGSNASLAIDSSGNPWVSHYDITNTSLRIANYVGSGGTGCASTAWTCTVIDNTGTNKGSQSGIAIDASNVAWVYYYNTDSTALNVAKYVGSGGSGCTSTAWTCTIIDNTGTVTGISQYSRNMAIGVDGNPWIMYNGNSINRYAHYVGSGGNCTDTAWQCNDIGFGSSWQSIAISPSGIPWFSFRLDAGTGAALAVARYVGGGIGDCDNGSDWNCEVVGPSSNGTTIGSYSSIVFRANGTPIISYNSINALLMVELNRTGEVLLGTSQRNIGTSLSESHADMSAIIDTTNRDDADCIGGGTWNSGIVVFAGRPYGGTLPDGSGTAQCTEIMFTIDLSQAVVGGTYRFMIASNDAIPSSGGVWRGPKSIASGAIPTLTITDSSAVYAKEASYKMPNCTDTEWGCDAIDSTNDVGAGNSMIIDQTGTPWVSFYDTTNANLRVAKYVGSGNGTGCNNNAWTCVDVDTTSTVGQYSSIAIDASGNPVISYYYGTGGDLRVARYVGSSGTGCASTAWTCTNVQTTNDIGKYSSVAVDQLGNPVVSYYDTTNGDLRLARYLGGATTGTGCAINTWTCIAIDSTNNVGDIDTNITVDTFGIIWISYYDTTNGDLRIAKNVGILGTGCADTAWTCTSVDTTSDVGKYSDIAVDSNGVAWVSYVYTTGTDLRVAKYVGTGGTGCASTAWTCTNVLTTPTTSNDSSIAIGADGNPWVSSYSTTTDALWVSRYVGGTSGTGCASTAWTCTTVDASTAAASSIVFDSTGAPWVSYYGGATDLKIAKLHRSLSAPSYTSVAKFNGVNASKSFARIAPTFGQVNGAAAGDCSGGLTDYLGICAYYQNNGDYDTLTAFTNESPYLTFASSFSTNTQLPTAQWVGKTSLAPNTAGTAGDIVLQAYHYGTTNAWETIASNTTSSGCNSDNCVLNGNASGTASEYFTADSSGNYWVYFRLYQEASTSAGATLKTDQFSAFTTAQKLGSGKVLQGGQKRALNQR